MLVNVFLKCNRHRKNTFKNAFSSSVAVPDTSSKRNDQQFQTKHLLLVFVPFANHLQIDYLLGIGEREKCDPTEKIKIVIIQQDDNRLL